MFMENGKTISDLVEEFLAGAIGEGPILVHKKMHRDGSGDFACLRGLVEGCDFPVNCENCYHMKNGSYCLKDGQPVNGLLAVEEKHLSLVERGATGAYESISEAVESLSNH
jgi:hypothetical protein